MAAEIEVQTGAYSQAQLKQAAADLVASGEVTWAAPDPTGAGLDVGVDKVDSGRTAPDSAARAPEAAEPTTAAGGIPVTVVEEATVELASRDLDSSPFSAGADMVVDAGGGYVGFCSTSFAFISGGQERLFTADLCGSTGQVWRTGRSLSNAVLGTMTAPAQNLPTYDIATISGGDYRGRVYTGPNTSNTTIAVAGYTAPVVNQILCYSGAPSGTVCNNRVTHTGLTINYGPGYVYDGITRTVQLNGQPAVGNGDSGGPVYAPTSDGRATAVGVISGISGGGSACTGDPSSANRSCSATALFAPVSEYFKANPNDRIHTTS